MSNLSNVEEKKQINYCQFCCNATVEPELTDNDSSRIRVGKAENGYRLDIITGNSEPTALVVSRWEKDLQCYSRIAIYKMKYCPECGKKLIEI